MDEIASALFVRYIDTDWVDVKYRKSAYDSGVFKDEYLVLWKICKQDNVKVSTTDSKTIFLVDVFEKHKYM